MALHFAGHAVRNQPCCTTFEPPKLLIFGLPVWYVTLLLKPEASILSAASTVIVFCMPDTVRLVQ